MPPNPAAVAYTAFALVMFAANSLLCRLALGGGSVDASSFTVLRLASGALMLLLIVGLRDRRSISLGADLGSAFWLLLYAAPFSFAYLDLTTGTGALILFSSVQVTMLVGAWRVGERPMVLQWAGLVIAFTGLIYLVSPGLSAPAPWSAGLMAIAGLSWGIYSLRGREVGDPLMRNARSFQWATLMGLIMLLPSAHDLHITPHGAVLAIASGAIASALGYVSWYAALRYLTATMASILQLSVAVLTAIGGVLFLAEAFTLRLGLSSLLVLGGVALAQVGRRARLTPNTTPGP